jgi:hypothetical protein
MVGSKNHTTTAKSGLKGDCGKTNRVRPSGVSQAGEKKELRLGRGKEPQSGMRPEGSDRKTEEKNEALEL